MFIFVRATVQATFSILTILFARARGYLSQISYLSLLLSIREWKHWEDSSYFSIEFLMFLRLRDQGSMHSMLHISLPHRIATLFFQLAFFKQFFGSVTKAEYMMMRLVIGSKFNFYKYMMRVLEADFKRVVGISWYLWLYVVVFLLLNVWG
ncbi:unnamed protein product [Prunus brigantina]